MKKIYSLVIASLLAFAAFSQVPGNMVIVKGYIVDANGMAVANHYVNILTDSITTPAGCQQSHTVVTNPNGYYVDTLRCNNTASGITKVIVATLNCNNNYLIENRQVPSTRIVEVNFTLCATTPVCHAAFTATVSGLTVSFTNTSSVSPSGSVTTPYWLFGDGTAASVMSPVHTYATGGVYQVKLIIYNTATGCKDSMTQVITLANSTGCHAAFFDSVIGNKVYFYSGSSMGASSTDAIVERNWNFGDPNSTTNLLGGNVVNPYHIYNTNGTYTACLKITTASGCRDSVCHTFTVNNTPTCQAYFNFTNVGTAFTLHSYSQASGGDSIISHKWKFGDGDSLAGNNLNPTHTYAPGTYNACLRIQTAGGCVHEYCRQVVVMADTCHAVFTATQASSNANLFYFTSSASTPANSIISRKWKFGDGDSLTGNVVTATHTYAQPGTYTVCLIIKTSSGCTSDVCHTITVPNTIHCIARYTYGPSPTVPPAGTSLLFNGSTSEASVGDSIANWYWMFGDGTTGSGVTPTHVYTAPGTYTACLLISTLQGCHDSICKVITVPTPNQCKAYFSANPVLTNPYLIQYQSANSTASTGTGIITRVWSFGDGDSLTGNVISPQHLYANAGTYTVCLKIITSNGCDNRYCTTITIAPAHCQSKLTFTLTPGTINTVHFNSSIAMAAAGDSIIQRIWSFGDGSGLTGNNVDPNHSYATAGNYTACLTIVTAKGCRDSACIQVVLSNNTYPCESSFRYERLTSTTTLNSVRFLSQASHGAVGDTIVSRYWNFGDGQNLSGNVINPIHSYSQPGTYNACLTIVTAHGCQNTKCIPVIVTPAPTVCVANFTFQQPAPRQIVFNSSSSWASAGDSIINRKWSFGDSTFILTGNVVSPVKTYMARGLYNVCLEINTAKGCSNRYCFPVWAGDSTRIDTTEPIKILAIAPNPATTQLSTVVWSKYNNVVAEYAVYDIYGVKKWSITKILNQNNNYFTIPVSNLLAGPYFFRVSTIYGIKSRKFYKL